MPQRRQPTHQRFIVPLIVLAGVALTFGVVETSEQAGCGGAVDDTESADAATVDGLSELESSLRSRQTPAGRCAETLYGRTIVVADDASPLVVGLAGGDLRTTLAGITGETFSVRTTRAFGGDCARQRRAIFLLPHNHPYLTANAPQAVTARLSVLVNGGVDPVGAAPPGLTQGFGGTIGSSPKVVHRGSNEGYILHAEPGAGLWIVGQREQGIRHGVYDYLDRLGVRWLAPGDKWTVIPQLSDIRLDKASVLREPAFRTVGMFGTGTFGNPFPALPIYPGSARLSEPWAKWFERSRFPAEYATFGHGYTKFHMQREAEIRQDPLMLAEYWDPAQNQRVRGGGKLHYTHHGTLRCNQAEATASYRDTSGVERCENPLDYQTYGGVIRSYSEWAVADLDYAARTPHLVPYSIAADVDPSDGGGHCDCAKCLNLLRHGPYGLQLNENSSVSDRVFHLANEVARHVARARPGKRAALYAYNEFSAVPRIPLEPNLDVLVAAYAYNQSGLTSEELVDAWRVKSETNARGPIRLGTRDYFCLPDWTANVPSPPSACSVSSQLAKMRYLHGKSLDYMSVESTYSLGAVGLLWYLAARVAWDIGYGDEAGRAEFIAKAFGPAAKPMARMFRRWDHLLLNDSELGQTYDDLLEADGLAMHASVSEKARLYDIKAYVHFVRLTYEFNRATTPARQRAALTSLMRFIWRIYDRGLVHSYRLYELFKNRWTRPGDNPLWSQTEWDTFWADWNLDDPGAAGFSTSIPLLTDPEIDPLVADGAAEYDPVAIEVREYSQTLVPVTPQPQPQQVDWTPLMKENHHHRFRARGPGAITVPAAFHTGQGDPSKVIQIRVVARSLATSEVIYAESFTPVPGWTEPTITLSVQAAGDYSFDVFPGAVANGIKFKFPANLPIVDVSGYQNVTGYGHQYFYVPEGLAQFAVHVQSAIPPKFFPPGARTPAVATQAGPAYYVDTNGQYGIWRFTGIHTIGNTVLTFLNLPQVIAHQPAQMMVPENLVP